jgi:hypothetical protein
MNVKVSALRQCIEFVRSRRNKRMLSQSHVEYYLEQRSLRMLKRRARCHYHLVCAFLHVASLQN